MPYVVCSSTHNLTENVYFVGMASDFHARILDVRESGHLGGVIP